MLHSCRKLLRLPGRCFLIRLPVFFPIVLHSHTLCIKSWIAFTKGPTNSSNQDPDHIQQKEPEFVDNLNNQHDRRLLSNARVQLVFLLLFLPFMPFWHRVQGKPWDPQLALLSYCLVARL